MAIQDRDERKPAELGYRQELERAWSGFSNFAISFTIISVLAGCFRPGAWNLGRKYRFDEAMGIVDEEPVAGETPTPPTEPGPA